MLSGYIELFSTPLFAPSTSIIQREYQEGSVLDNLKHHCWQQIPNTGMCVYCVCVWEGPKY